MNHRKTKWRGGRRQPRPRQRNGLSAELRDWLVFREMLRTPRWGLKLDLPLATNHRDGILKHG